MKRSEFVSELFKLLACGVVGTCLGLFIGMLIRIWRAMPLLLVCCLAHAQTFAVYEPFSTSATNLSYFPNHDSCIETVTGQTVALRCTYGDIIPETHSEYLTPIGPAYTVQFYVYDVTIPDYVLVKTWGGCHQMNPYYYNFAANAFFQCGGGTDEIFRDGFEP